MPVVGPIYSYSAHINHWNIFNQPNYNNTAVPYKYAVGKMNQNSSGTDNKLPWDERFFYAEGVLKDDVRLDGEVMAHLRQHAKAIIAHFETLGGTVPDFNRVSDPYLTDDTPVTNEEFNETDGIVDPVNSGLLDDMDQGLLDVGLDGGPIPSGVATGMYITKDKINEIAAKLQSAANYQNYGNHVDTGYKEHNNGYINHGNSHSNTYRGRGHRHHSNHNNWPQNNVLPIVTYIGSYVNYTNKYVPPYHQKTIKVPANSYINSLYVNHNQYANSL